MKTFLTTTAVLAVSAIAALADCGAPSGSVRILANDFNSLRAVTGFAQQCASDRTTVTVNHSTEHSQIQGPALTVNPAEYTVAVVSNSSLTQLLNEGLVRPLDDLVAQHGQGLAPNQLVRIDGKVMAIAFMANAQHFFLRTDILAAAGVEPPATYDEVLAAAEAIRSQGILQYPIAGTYEPGWNLGQEFVNIYIGMGGQFFEPGSARPAIQNATAVAALDLMKALSGYMDPDFLTFDTDDVIPRFEAGQTAMGNFWGSRAGTLTPETMAVTLFEATPTAGGGTAPATTVWWDGFTIAKNISDEDAAASFVAMLHGISPEMAAANPKQAVWLIPGVEPEPSAVGVVGSARGGAPSYPMLPWMGYLHMAIDQNLAEFLNGQESAEQALADATAAYVAAATEAGYLR